MKKLLQTLVDRIVDDPSAVRIREERRRDTADYFVRVAPDDVGKIIGKRGRVASAIRTIVGAAGSKDRVRAYVKFVTE
jgi:predicted RNA-binding protein YlqC (UPF0109 family)